MPCHHLYLTHTLRIAYARFIPHSNIVHLYFYEHQLPYSGTLNTPVIPSFQETRQKFLKEKEYSAAWKKSLYSDRGRHISHYQASRDNLITLKSIGYNHVLQLSNLFFTFTNLFKRGLQAGLSSTVVWLTIVELSKKIIQDISFLFVYLASYVIWLYIYAGYKIHDSYCYKSSEVQVFSHRKNKKINPRL